MSLDVYLKEPDGEPCVCNGVCPCHQTEVFSQNITHNLGRMAAEAGIYEACWRPEEIGITKAAELIVPLKTGLLKLKANRNYFEQFNATNGWGLYENFVPWLERYLKACQEHPEATVRVSR